MILNYNQLVYRHQTSITDIKHTRQVHPDISGYPGIPSIPGYTRVYLGAHGCTRVYLGIPGNSRVYPQAITDIQLDIQLLRRHPTNNLRAII